MSSLYDTTMKREKMIHNFEQLLAQYRAYFEEAGIDINGKAPELMLYKEALRIYTSLPQMKNMDPLCIMEGEYDLLRSILSDMQTGNWMTSPYFKRDAVLGDADSITIPIMSMSAIHYHLHKKPCAAY